MGPADYVTGYTKYNERSDSSSEIGGCIVWVPADNVI